MKRPRAESVLVLYASQTGTAQEVAERIGREGRRRRFRFRVCSMDAYQVQQLISEEILVIVAATTGQGDPPDNMKRFWKFLLRKDIPLGSLANIKFSVLGLGDSSYVKFNFIAKKLHRRLIQLGAVSLQDIGLADDQHPGGLEAIANPWIENLWRNILQHLPMNPGEEIVSQNVRPISRYKVVVESHHAASVSLQSEENGVSKLWLQENPFMSKLIDNRRVTSDDHFQDVRLITFDLKDSDLRYDPGDVLMIQPQNTARSVNDFLVLMKLDPEQKIRLVQNDADFEVPKAFQGFLTLHDVVKLHLDIQGVPKRYFFELLSHFTTSDLERERLQEFSSTEGQDDLMSYCHRQRRTYYEVLQDFPVAASNVPLDYLFDLIPMLKPRAFSIASSQKMYPDAVQILMAVVKYRTKLSQPREGVCSTWLSEISPHENNEVRIPVWITKGSFSFPSTSPLIMVGPGTGCAPFRSFLQEWFLSEERRSHQECCVFFGCRQKEKDFLMEETFKKMASCKTLTTYTAFSRDQDSKVYVQHLIRREKTTIWNLLCQGAFVFIAGNAKQMPADVSSALKEVVEEEGGLNNSEAESYLRKLETGRRLQCETWS